MKTHECKICGEQVVLECFDYDECDNNKSSASSAGSIQTEQKMRETLESIKAWDIEQSLDYDKHLGGLFILPEDLRKMIENALGN